MASFKAVFSSLVLLLLAHYGQCNITATLGTLQLDGPCQLSIISTGSLAVSGGGRNASIGGTFEVATELDDNYRVGLSVYQLKPAQGESNRILVSARSGILCSAIGDFQWLLHDVKVEPVVEECPIPAGRYTVKGFQFDNERFKFLEEGNYEISLRLFREDEPICGVKVDMKWA